MLIFIIVFYKHFSGAVTYRKICPAYLKFEIKEKKYLLILMKLKTYHARIFTLLVFLTLITHMW